MKVSKKSARSKQHALPDKRFQDQKLTSHAGASILQLLFKRLGLKSRLSRCFGLMALTLVVHLFLGKRKLQDIRYYENDSLVCRLLCVENIPTCSTVSRRLAEPDEISVSIVRGCNRDIILQRLKEEQLPRVTLDFDGSVLSTSLKAQGTAVGYNKKKKGQRSYYPLFCTLAQTGQVLDVWHRPGNVHDSNGATEFILSCISAIKSTLPRAIIEIRMVSTFFCEDLVAALHKERIEFSISVPFARYTNFDVVQLFCTPQLSNFPSCLHLHFVLVRHYISEI